MAVSLVEVSSLPRGVVQNDAGDALEGVLASINTTVYTTANPSGPTLAPAAFVTNHLGELPGFIEEGTWTLSILGIAHQVDVRSGTARTHQHSMLLYAGDPRAASALVTSTSVVYGFQGSALSSSMHLLLSGLNAYVANAYAQFVWTPNAVGCGVEIISADIGPANIAQITEATGSAAVTPINTMVDITSAVRALVDSGTALGTTKQIGFRTKGDGAVSPLIYSVRVLILTRG